MTFDGLYEFTPEGLAAFQKAFSGQIEEAAINLKSAVVAKRVLGTTSFTVEEWETAQEMAQSILHSAGLASIPELLAKPGVWGWLAFVLRDIAYPLRKDGMRKLGEIHRWYPSDLNDYQKGQRHLIRMPVLLLSSFGENAAHLLCGPPPVPGELREQLTSQQDMFHPAFQAAARALYYDAKRKTLRPGSAGKRGGSARRLAKVRQQLDVTWDLFALSADQILEKLPGEFDRFKADSVVFKPATAVSRLAEGQAAAIT
jgi:hypothetical protein